MGAQAHALCGINICQSIPSSDYALSLRPLDSYGHGVTPLLLFLVGPCILCSDALDRLCQCPLYCPFPKAVESITIQVDAVETEFVALPLMGSAQGGRWPRRTRSCAQNLCIVS